MLRRTASRTALAVLLLAVLGSCGKDDPPPAAAAEVAPAEARIGPEGPVGLYVRTPFPAAGKDPEPAAWYFAPNGQVYENPSAGFSPADLAAHRGRRGARTLEGSNMTVAWAGGRSTTTAFSPAKKDGPGFGWDLASFRPATPFGAGRSPAGTWRLPGDAAATLTFRPDGSYDASGLPDLPAATGTWKAAAHSITLSAGAGAASRRVAFPVDEGRLYFSGRVWRRSSGG